MPYKDPEKRLAYHRKYSKDRYQSDSEFREQNKKRSKKNTDKYLKESRQLVAEFRKKGCKLCDEKDHDCLCAHHKNPAAKLFSLGKLVTLKPSPARVKRELKKCECLCFNCHAKLHGKQRRKEST